jgi:type IV secretory pathway TraG/TraD family ATPase VirD4
VKIFSVAEWAEHRQGWVFVTSIPEAREQLRPLISMWLDMMILRLMNQGRRGTRSVWFVLDELSSLHRLPQLLTAITENRKAGNPVVLCFQGRSQLESIYGHQAEAMLSQPATKIFLKTSEPRAAQWISDTLGEVELERLRESRTHGQMPRPRESRSYQLEREVRPLVMKEEITGLPKGYGFFKCGNLVVRISFPYFELPERHPRLLERKTPPASVEDSDTRLTQSKAPPSPRSGTFENRQTPSTKPQSPRDNRPQEEQQTFLK